MRKILLILRILERSFRAVAGNQFGNYERPLQWGKLGSDRAPKSALHTALVDGQKKEQNRAIKQNITRLFFSHNKSGVLIEKSIRHSIIPQPLTPPYLHRRNNYKIDI
jgi:hypothetical protein